MNMIQFPKEFPKKVTKILKIKFDFCAHEGHNAKFMSAAKISNSGMRTKFQSTGHLHNPMNDISKKIIQFIFHRSVSSMGIIAMIWEKISNKGFFFTKHLL